jgi:polyphosphate kinase
MHRNLSARVEVVTPVRARSARERLWEILALSLSDQRQAWELDASGPSTQLCTPDAATGVAQTGSHQALMDLTRRRAAQVG